MEPENLSTYVNQQIQAGKNGTEIKDQLTAVGWSDEEADQAYAEALIANGVPVPDNGGRGTYLKKSSTVEVILNFFSFILLGTVVFSMGTLYFAIINHYFQDALDNTRSYYYYQRVADTIHYAIAALVIAYPLYYFAVKLWFKKFKQDETKVESKLTKWVTYLVLLSASLTIVGDLISIVYTFLQGEITSRFFLKALTTLVIAGMVFGFYYLERKKVQYKVAIPRDVFKIFGYVLTFLVALGITFGFLVAGSPATARMQAFDDSRANDLSQIATCLQNYAQAYKTLPNNLSELRNTSYPYCADKKDPETELPYQYRLVEPLSQSNINTMTGKFELCATFSLPAEGLGNNTYNNAYLWENHTSGRNCDTQTVSVSTNR